MRLYHVSLKARTPNIMTKGIDPSYSQGARKECWYVTMGKLAWAMLHVQKRHKVSLDEVVAFEVLIPSNKLTRRRRGVYTCFEVMTPIFIVSQVDGDWVADSYPPERNGDMMKF